MNLAATVAPYEPTRASIHLVQTPAPPAQKSAQPARAPISMDRVVASMQLMLATRRAARLARSV